jgi:small nuclear ribonucleoprotein (snRNP)-like protein
MRWEDRGDDSVLGMLDDLEMQAEGLHLAERAVEVNELSVAQYAEVELVGRLHASVGRMVRVATTAGIDLHGRLTGTGADWVLISDGHGRASFVHLSAVAFFGGLAPGSMPVDARPLSARLSLRSALRQLAEDRRVCTLHLKGGRTLQGNLVRAGADFAVLRQGETADQLTVPVTSIAVVQSRAEERP